MQDTSFIALVTSLISNIGFPIVVTGFLLLRLEMKIEALNNTFLELLQSFGMRCIKSNEYI